MENKNFWESERSTALFKLIFWLIFILVVYLVMTYGFEDSTPVSNEENNQQEVTKEEQEDVKKIINNLTNKDFDYTYHIVIGEEKYNFEGKLVNNLEDGYKQNNDGTIIKYQIIDNETYQINNERNEKIDNLYENMQKEFLDYQFINNLIQEQNISNIPYEFDYLEYHFLLSKDSDNSFKVEIKKDNNSYELSYTNISQAENEKK